VFYDLANFYKPSDHYHLLNKTVSLQIINHIAMKKVIVLFAALAIWSFAGAQSVNFGPKVGFTTAQLSTDLDDIKTDFQTNFYGGVFLRMGKKAYLQPEVNFVTKGGIIQKKDLVDDQTIKLKTIEVPVLLGSRLIDLKFANLRLMAGPSVSFVIDKDVSLKGNDEPIFGKDSLKDALWGIQAGAGLDILMFTLDIRYEWGLTNMTSLSEVELTNSMFNVSLGWKIF